MKKLGRIRPMRTEDLEQVMEIWLNANLQAHGFLPDAYWLQRQEAVRDAVARSESLVYENDGRIYGFAGLVENYLAGLFVETQSRSRGLGAMLLEACKERRRELSLDVYEENPRAKAFYERHGFSAVRSELDPPPHVSWRMVWRKRESG